MSETWTPGLRAANKLQKLGLCVTQPAGLLAGVIDEETAVSILCEAVEFSMLAIDDWLNLHAPEHCDKDRVEQARSRIANRGGTLAYIAEVQASNRNALAKARGETDE